MGSIHRLSWLVAAAALAAGTPAWAQYPAKPIRLIVPFPAGSANDLVARFVAPPLSDGLGRQVVIDNRAGAAGNIGADVAAKSPPDGYTLMMANIAHAISMTLYDRLPYDIVKDFAPVSLLTRNTVMLVVHPSVPAQTLQEFMALARANPGQLFYASSGVGGPNHLAGEIFNRTTGLQITHVPFQGTGLALQAVISNQVGAMWGFMAGLIPHIRGGSLRALAVGGSERSAALPNVPTVAEAGVSGYEAVSWIGMVAPAGLPVPVMDKLWGAVHAAMAEKSVTDNLASGGSEIVASKPEEFRQVIERDYAKYGKLSDLFKSAN